MLFSGLVKNCCIVLNFYVMFLNKLFNVNNTSVIIIVMMCVREVCFCSSPRYCVFVVESKMSCCRVKVCCVCCSRLRCYVFVAAV